MGDLSARKLAIIRMVMLAQDERTVAALEAVLARLLSDEPYLAAMLQPAREHLDPVALKQEQNWHPVDRATFDRLIDEADIQESLDELLAQLQP